ncbi:hypothetical protein pb186bvf_020107 [Paramecium bursaria]
MCAQEPQKKKVKKQFIFLKYSLSYPKVYIDEQKMIILNNTILLDILILTTQINGNSYVTLILN